MAQWRWKPPPPAVRDAQARWRRRYVPLLSVDLLATETSTLASDPCKSFLCFTVIDVTHHGIQILIFVFFSWNIAAVLFLKAVCLLLDFFDF